MSDAAENFQVLVLAVLRGYFAQNGEPAPADAELGKFGARLWSRVEDHAVPPPSAAPGCVQPVGPPEAEIARMAAAVVGEMKSPVLAEAARQLVKACFYPEFSVCRDSFREASPDGSCRRQDLSRV